MGLGWHCTTTPDSELKVAVRRMEVLGTRTVSGFGMGARMLVGNASERRLELSREPELDLPMAVPLVTAAAVRLAGDGDERILRLTACGELKMEPELPALRAGALNERLDVPGEAGGAALKAAPPRSGLARPPMVGALEFSEGDRSSIDTERSAGLNDLPDLSRGVLQPCNGDDCGDDTIALGASNGAAYSCENVRAVAAAGVR